MMQTRCPKCKTIVRLKHPHWQILNGSCPELSGTQWANEPEWCPTLSQVAEPDVTLPGTANRAAVLAEIERVRVVKARV